MNVEEIFDALVILEYKNIQKITELQTKIYTLLQKNPQDATLLALLMQTEIMLGKKEKTQDIAYKIWELGQDMPEPVHIIFINNLMNIGLMEMASQIFKNIFNSKIDEVIDSYYSVMIKFATLSGSVFLLQKIMANLKEEINSQNLQALIEMINLSKYEEHFKNLQKIVYREAKTKACSFEVMFYDNNEQTSWDIMIFMKGDIYERNDIFQKIEKEINIYLEQNQPNHWIVPNVSVIEIEEHWPLAGY